jgi:3-oxoacyl-[acyl-carrier protein] reductase
MQTRPNPVIVVIGSIEGIRPNINHAPYGVFKAALHHLVTAAAYELGQKNIRVVGVAPGLIQREGLEADWKEGVKSFGEHSALHRIIDASEVAKVVRFLASEDASAITGITIPVDAGWSAHPGW